MRDTISITSSLPLAAANTAGILGTQALLAMDDASYMGQAQLSYFKQLLEGMSAQLSEQAQQAQIDLGVSESNADPVDRASSEEAHLSSMRAHIRELEQLAQVRRAIARIECGDFGWCEETGEAIGIARLLAQPTARLSYEAQCLREKKAKYIHN